MRRYFLLILFFVISSLSAQIPMKFSGNLLENNNTKINKGTVPGSRIKYILYSLLLPGAGQWAMGNHNRAKFFVGAEALLWIGYFGSHAYANMAQDDYKSYAALHANLNSRDKSEQYWIDIGSSVNMYNFNQKRLRERDLKGTYPENDKYFWQWDSEQNIEKYNTLRVKEYNWEKRTTYVVGALILNRLISAIDVIRLIGKEKRESQNRSSMLYFDYRSNKINLGFYQLNFKIYY
jgi:hypothetical protein